MPDSSSRAPWSTALVVGASSGIGAAVVRLLASQGVRTAALARRQDELEKLAAAAAEATGRDDLVVPVAHDVRKVDEVPDLFAHVCALLGGLDLIVYSAGTMTRSASERFDPAADRETIEVNFTGAVAWLDEAAARFEEARAGTIVGVGSVAGDRGRRGQPVYGATKAALHTYLEALRNRLASRGVRVVTVKPGFIDTEMTRGMPSLFWLISADDAAAQILAAAARGSVTCYVPARWRVVSWVLRAIPSPVFRYLPI